MEFFWHLLISIGHSLPTMLGFNLVFGKGKIFHFGPYGVSVATGYAMYVTLMATNSFSLALVAAIAMAAVMSLLFSWLSLRLQPDALGVLTIAVHLSFISIILNWQDVTRGALGIPGIPRHNALSSIEMYTLVTLGTAVLFLLFFWWIERSALGRQLEALAEHPWHAESLGVRRSVVHSLAFIVLGLAHVHGNFFFIQYIHFLHPNDYGFPALIFLVMIVVAGKPGSLWGVTLSTALLVLLKEALRFVALPADILGPMRLILFGVILFIAVWWRRDSLFPKQRSV